MGTEDWTWVLMFVGQAPYQLTYHPSPSKLTLYLFLLQNETKKQKNNQVNKQPKDHQSHHPQSEGEIPVFTCPILALQPTYVNKLTVAIVQFQCLSAHLAITSLWAPNPKSSFFWLPNLNPCLSTHSSHQPPLMLPLMSLAKPQPWLYSFFATTMLALVQQPMTGEKPTAMVTTFPSWWWELESMGALRQLQDPESQSTSHATSVHTMGECSTDHVEATPLTRQTPKQKHLVLLSSA